MIDWMKTALTIVSLAGKKKHEVDPQYMVIKPRALSDDNLLAGLGALKTVLRFIPAAALVSQAMGLGDAGFRLWKRMALQQEYDGLYVPPVGTNTISLKFRLDPVLREHFLPMLTTQNWVATQQAFNALIYITDPVVLQARFPELPADYVAATCAKNQALLGETLEQLKQVIEDHRSIPEVDQNVQGAVDALLGIFPSMRDWALVKSENFHEVIKIIDTVV